MRLSIGKKLGLGFSAVLALMLVSSVIVYLSVVNMNRSVDAASSCEQMTSALNLSVASLRGYVILGHKPAQATFFRDLRADAWKRMDAGLNSISPYYTNTTRASDRKSFEVILDNFESLRNAQQSAEAIAQTKDNVPSQKIMIEEAAPATELMLESITTMIDAETSQESSAERAKLLRNMADFRNSLLQSLLDLQSFLMDADPKFQSRFKQHWQTNEEAYEAIESLAALHLGSQLAAWKNLKQHRETFAPLPDKMFTSRESPDWNQATFLVETKSSPTAKTVRDALEALRISARADLAAASSTLTTTLIVATLSAVIIGGIIAVLLSRRIVAAVNQVLSRVRIVAAGDLTGDTVDVRSDDEIGDLAQGFNQMVKSLRTVLAETSATTREVATASNEIAAGAQQQLAGLTQTATSLNQITTTAEEFKATMQEFADRARAVQEAADDTTKQTAAGRILTQESGARIEQVRINSRTAGGSVLKLAEQMQRIGEITATVNEIAEQTKLLALNASIEAARAGEEGRGFAVVATQVRELANQSKESAGRIESLITDTQRSMQEVARRSEEGSRLAEDSVESVQQMAKAFEEIANAIEQTREAMSQINTGARQQEDGIVELVSSITEIDTGSRESVASAEQTQKAIVAINQRIQSLNESIERFKT
jgi:methyl-accepting chemotaxis protein